MSNEPEDALSDYRRMYQKYVCKRLLAALCRAQKQRDMRPDQIDTERGREIAWVVYEREELFRAVTFERAKLGKGPVPIERLIRCEQMSAGHADYTDKYTLYATELVFE